MKGPKSRALAEQERLSRQRKYLTLFIYVVIVCLSFGAYTLLVNALTHDGAGEAHAPLRSLAAPDAPAVMRIEPASQSVGPGAALSVTVMIKDVINLGAFEFELTYNSTVLSATDVVSGSFLGSTGRSVFPVGPTYGTGSVNYGAFSLPPPSDGPNGDGVLATIAFQTTFVGTSTLHLQNVTVTDPNGVEIPTSTEDGEVTVGTAPGPSVTSIAPNSGDTSTVVENVIVGGENFQTGASVQLTKSGQKTISAPLPDVQSSTRISCTFNLEGAVTGQWDVVVTNSDSQSGTLPNGFTVNEACVDITGVNLTPLTSGDIYTDTNVQFSADIMPDNAGKPYTYTINYDDGTTPVTASSSDDPLTTALDHTFTTIGTYDVEIAAWNCTMGQTDTVTDTVAMEVTTPEPATPEFWIYLPIVVRNH